MNDDSSLARGWLAKAESDLDAATKLLDAGTSYDAVCFHAQQAAEKFLKAVLARNRVEIPRTHDLGELRRLGSSLPDGHPLVSVDVDPLTVYAVEARYDFEFWPDRETAAEAVSIARRLGMIVQGIVTDR